MDPATPPSRISRAIPLDVKVKNALMGINLGLGLGLGVGLASVFFAFKYW